MKTAPKIHKAISKMAYNHNGGDDLCWYNNQQVSLPAISTSNDVTGKFLNLSIFSSFALSVSGSLVSDCVF